MDRDADRSAARGVKGDARARGGLTLSVEGGGSGEVALLGLQADEVQREGSEDSRKVSLGAFEHGR